MVKDSYVFVRASVTSSVAEDDPPIGSPVVPGTWKMSEQDGGWYSAKTPGDEIFAIYRVGPVSGQPSKGIWVVLQRIPDGRAALDDLAGAGGNDLAEPAKTAWQSAQAGNAARRLLLRHWPDWKVTGFTKDADDNTITLTTSSVRLFQRDSAFLLPDSIWTGSGPWHLDHEGNEVPHLDSAEKFHITTFHRPTLRQTIAGFDDPSSVEDTE